MSFIDDELPDDPERPTREDLEGLEDDTPRFPPTPEQDKMIEDAFASMGIDVDRRTHKRVHDWPDKLRADRRIT